MPKSKPLRQRMRQRMQSETLRPSASDIYPMKSLDRKSTRLNSSYDQISYAVFCLKKKKKNIRIRLTIPVTHMNLKLLTHTRSQDYIRHRTLTRRTIAIDNIVSINICLSQSNFDVK